MRWLIVLPSEGAEHMGMDFRAELEAMGHAVSTFAYRRRNPLYTNKGTKAAYQLWILRRLERACAAWRPHCVLVIKGGPITPGLIRRVKARVDTLFRELLPRQPAPDDPLRVHRGLRPLLHEGALRAPAARAGRPPQPLPSSPTRRTRSASRST